MTDDEARPPTSSNGTGDGRLAHVGGAIPGTGAAGPRTLILSQRRIERSLAYTSWTEAEDVLVSHGSADLHLLEHRGSSAAMRARALVGRTVRRVAKPDVLLPPVGRGRLRDGDRYDVAVAVLKTVWDLGVVENLPGLRGAAGAVVGWFPEVWPSELADKVALEPFSLLDEVFVGEPRSAEQLSSLLGRPVHFLPLATDVETFSGTETPGLPARGDGRPIDVLNIGRRDPRLHDELVRWSRSAGRYYVFDTLSGAVAEDPAAHRRALADQLQRTSVAISSYAKQGVAIAGDVRWVPSRVFDDLAAGTVMAGVPPEAASQRALFGREVVHPLPEDPVQAAQVVADLVSAPLIEERRQNVRTAMAGHDWSHRWVSLLETSGFAPGARLVERATSLRRQAAMDRDTAPRC